MPNFQFKESNSICSAKRSCIAILLCFFGLSGVASAVPQCTDIFTDSPTGNHHPFGLVLPNGILSSSLDDLTCESDRCIIDGIPYHNQFPKGDFDYNVGRFENFSRISTSGATTRLYFNSLSLTNANLNQGGNPEDLIIYVANSLSIAGQNQINGIVYVAGSVTVSGHASINGALASGGALAIQGRNAQVVVNKAAVKNADFAGMCDSTVTPQSSLALQFGNATSGTVVFDTPFEAVITPLIFVMPTITDDDPEDNDGPASVFLTQVTNTGFSWRQIEPETPRGRSDIDSRPMSEVHWIAITPGQHELSDGTYLEAGTVNVNEPFYKNKGSYKQVTTSRKYDVVLNQIQSSANNCWLTSTAKRSNDGLSVGIDVSEVVNAGPGSGYGNKKCLPGKVKLNKLKPERVAYLALESGTGKISIDGKDIQYQFGSDFWTLNSWDGVDANQQCSTLRPLVGFTKTPVFVAGKHSRYDNNGGWLRRCQLTKNTVSMVTDEDRYQNSERDHTAEKYGFVALEVIEDTPELDCFNDDFNRDELGDNWAIKTLGSSAPPAIMSNKMRITPARGNQATSSTYQRLFPAADNFVQVEFDYFAWSPSRGTGGDGVAIILSDASITPQPGSFGGALGYAQRNNGTQGFAGGWIGIGLDEYGNFSNPSEGKVKGPGARAQSVAIRGSASSGYMYLAGTAASLTPGIDVREVNNAAPNHRYRITVDSREAGEALVLVERDVKDGNGFQVLIPEFNARNIPGQGGVPDDFYLSITGSTGGANNNHELDNFQVCALASKPVGQLVHHFEFDYSNSPLTCNAEEMTVRACRNADCDPFTDPVTATLFAKTKASGGWVGGNDVKFVDGRAKVSLRSNTTVPVTIGVTSSFPSTVAGSDTLCKKGSGLLDKASCTIEFATSGFIFEIPDEFSNKPSKEVLVKAVKDKGSQQCVPAFKGKSKYLAFWSDYIAPSTGTKKISVKSGATEEEIGDSDINPKTFLLDFNKDGEAKIDVNYADAGKMQLNSRYTGTGDESGLIMNGSKQFVRRPVGLCVESEACDNCSVTSKKYKRAGEEFNIKVKAMAWQSDPDADICSGNTVTPNFTHKSVEFTHELIRPSVDDGGVKGMLGVNEYEQTSGEQTIKQSVSEVGIFTFSVTPKAGGYFGYDIPGATTASMGRFTPYYLTATPTEPELQPSCETVDKMNNPVVFTYMDEPFVFKTGADPRLLVIGKGKAGNETKNYQIKTEDENWWKYNNQWDERKFSNLAGSPLPTLEDVSPDSSSVAFLDGVSDGARLTYLQKATLRYKRTSTPLAPFDALFELKLSADDLKDSDGICYQKSATSVCVGVTFKDIAKGDDFELRYGRLQLDNGYSPQSESLRLSLRTEYVSAVDAANVPTWVTNANDNCSVYNTLTSTDTTETATTGMNMTSPAGFPVITAHSDSELTLKSGVVAAGVDQIYFTAPNVPGEVQLKQHIEPWLKWYWNYDGNANELYDPRASAFFGTYRGHDKVIYWREVN